MDGKIYLVGDDLYYLGVKVGEVSGKDCTSTEYDSFKRELKRVLNEQYNQLYRGV